MTYNLFNTDGFVDYKERVRASYQSNQHYLEARLESLNVFCFFVTSVYISERFKIS